MQASFNEKRIVTQRPNVSQVMYTVDGPTFYSTLVCELKQTHILIPYQILIYCIKTHVPFCNLFFQGLDLGFGRIYNM